MAAVGLVVGRTADPEVGTADPGAGTAGGSQRSEGVPRPPVVGRAPAGAVAPAVDKADPEVADLGESVAFQAWS